MFVAVAEMQKKPLTLKSVPTKTPIDRLPGIKMDKKRIANYLQQPSSQQVNKGPTEKFLQK
jgi:hypothetical protein